MHNLADFMRDDDDQEALRLEIAARVLPAIMAEGLRVCSDTPFDHWAKLALAQADALLIAHATTPINMK